MRKGAGLSALSRHTTTTTSYASLSSTLSSNQLTALQSSLNSFRDTLIAFARSHRDDILRDPAFRHQFTKMCGALGVDPLVASTSPSSSGLKGKSSAGGLGGIWEKLGLGEWSYELCVQLVDVCVSTRGLNGGLIEVGELVRRIERMRSGGQADNSIAIATTPRTSSSPSTTSIDTEDIRRAINLLKPLAGYHLLTLPNSSTTYVRSVPRELDLDQTTLLSLAMRLGGGPLSEKLVSEKLGWNSVRSRAGLEGLVMREGIGWVDGQDEERSAQGSGLGFAGEGVGGSVWVIAAVDLGDR